MGSWDYSIAPASKWSDSLEIKKIAGKKLTFDKNEGHLQYEGSMLEEVRDRLLKLVQSDEEKKAIETLYHISHIVPKTNMIL